MRNLIVYISEYLNRERSRGIINIVIMAKRNAKCENNRDTDIGVYLYVHESPTIEFPTELIN